VDSSTYEPWWTYPLTGQKYYLMNDCGSNAGALVYFITFYVISNYAMMNLFVAVILDNFAFAVNVDLAYIKALLTPLSATPALTSALLGGVPPLEVQADMVQVHGG